jgi:hypothetical protein
MKLDILIRIVFEQLLDCVKARINFPERGPSPERRSA